MNRTSRHMALMLLAGLLILPATIAAAQGHQDSPDFSTDQVAGAWIAQINGEVFFPPPLDGLNGPFLRTARITITHKGVMSVTSIANFGGVVLRESYPGTIRISKDGAITIVFHSLPIPTLGDTPNVFTFEGYLTEQGKKMKIMLSNINLNGQDLPNLGTVLWGELTRQ